MNNDGDLSNNNTQASFIEKMMEKVLAGKNISFEEAQTLLSTTDIQTLAKCANIITRKFNGDIVDMESLINAKIRKLS